VGDFDAERHEVRDTIVATSRCVCSVAFWLAKPHANGSSASWPRVKHHVR
jgi:hypothetical protein